MVSNQQNTGRVNVARLVRDLLDGGYQQQTQRVLLAIAAPMQSGIVAQRLNELDEEVLRLVESGKRLTPDNAVLRALLADMDDVLTQNIGRIQDASSALQSDAITSAGQITRQLTLPGFSDEALAAIGVSWNRPDPAAIAQLIDYVDTPAWRQLLRQYPDDIINVVKNQAIQGIASGWSPRRTAAAIRKTATGLPVAQAQTLMRTLQLQSYRSASALHQTANADILSHQVRISALDNRVCLACVALHGSSLPIGERVNDHHNGRCTSIAVVKGRSRNVISGEDWFNGLSPQARRQLAGKAKFAALESGAVTLQDFVGQYDDSVFGEMVRENSLAGILGNAAKEYYR